MLKHLQSLDVKFPKMKSHIKEETKDASIAFSSKCRETLDYLAILAALQLQDLKYRRHYLA